MATRDVAIYAPFSSGAYERNARRVGGAERQMTLLAESLAARGHTVAHIVFPVAAPRPGLDPRLDLVFRSARSSNWAAGATEVISIWRALRAADASVVIVRTAAPIVGIAAMYCLLHRRRFVFSGANDSDFTFGEALGPRWHRRRLYSLGVRLADAIVVQSGQQEALARHTFPSLRTVIHIPSFAEDQPQPGSTRRDPDGFLWLGRVVDYKQPLRYLELARALPEAQFFMIPVEDDAREHRSLVKTLHVEARSVPNLELLDPAPHRDIQERISRAVAIVSTSRLEGMPNVFLEAWAHGVPVLSLEFDPDGAIAEHRLGFAAEGSWERFVAEGRAMWEERLSRGSKYAHAREYVARVHSPEGVSSRWSELITKLGGSRRKWFRWR